jgi:hypothetical protein
MIPLLSDDGECRVNQRFNALSVESGKKNTPDPEGIIAESLIFNCGSKAR